MYLNGAIVDASDLSVYLPVHCAQFVCIRASAMLIRRKEVVRAHESFARKIAFYLDIQQRRRQRRRDREKVRVFTGGKRAILDIKKNILLVQLEF